MRSVVAIGRQGLTISIVLKLTTSAVIAGLAGMAPTASNSPRQSSGTPGIMDYLIQDVCVDSQDRLIAGDPATCASHRNLRLGERLPYIVTDFDRAAGISLASFSSIPVRSTQGDTMVLVVKSLEGRYTPDYRFSFSGARDAFDLIETSHSPYASIVRTFDGGCFDQIFARNRRGGSRADRA